VRLFPNFSTSHSTRTGSKGLTSHNINSWYTYTSNIPNLSFSLKNRKRVFEFEHSKIQMGNTEEFVPSKDTCNSTGTAHEMNRIMRNEDLNKVRRSRNHEKNNCKKVKKETEKLNYMSSIVVS
jgi:hypothetical protein